MCACEKGRPCPVCEHDAVEVPSGPPVQIVETEETLETEETVAREETIDAVE